MGTLRSKPHIFGVLIAGGLLVTSFNNCTKISTAPIDPLQKSRTVGGSVFDTPRDGQPGGDNPGGKPPGSDNPGGKPPGADQCVPHVIPVKYDCSNARTASGVNAMLSTAVKVVLTVGNCSDDSDSIRTTLLNEKKLVSAKCAAELSAASCSAYIERAGISLKATNAAGVTSELISTKSGRTDLYVLYNVNDAATNAVCDNASSPLFVLLKEAAAAPKAVEFSAPLDGILFDIYGQRRENKPYLISWYKNESLYFLVKPNAAGEVKSADELFGDNTKGPDGRYASNGYLALAKHDSDSDGVISANDVVYSELRLWNDKNYDGISQQSELFTLAEKHIEVIDLNYDANYKEEDRWGNKIMYKSVMRTEDQEMHVMFDIWFRTLPAHLKEDRRFIGRPVFSAPLGRR